MGDDLFCFFIIFFLFWFCIVIALLLMREVKSHVIELTNESIEKPWFNYVYLLLFMRHGKSCQIFVENSDITFDTLRYALSVLRMLCYYNIQGFHPPRTPKSAPKMIFERLLSDFFKLTTYSDRPSFCFTQIHMTHPVTFSITGQSAFAVFVPSFLNVSIISSHFA